MNTSSVLANITYVYKDLSKNVYALNNLFEISFKSNMSKGRQSEAGIKFQFSRHCQKNCRQQIC